jgi:outer membrane protein OmpA-like peptidoglycan-associated protein
MATPIVAGIAALARTKWNDKDVHSSRFIMGQIASNAGPVANALASVSIAPTPHLSFLEYWLFDTAAQSPENDNDGIVDALDKCPTVYAKTADGCPEAAPKKLTLEGVNFGNNSATLQQDSFATLDAAAATLQEWGDVKVEVAGHTDSVGKDSYNLALSQRRAEAVRQYLVGKGVAANRLFARGYGETRPVADNATEEGRLQNRRVELVAIQ